MKCDNITSCNHSEKGYCDLNLTICLGRYENKKSENTSSKLINKKAYITDKKSLYYKEWGIVKHYDGEAYHIAIANDINSIPIFSRNQFQVKR